MGLFDDLVPAGSPAPAGGGLFADLIPAPAPSAMTTPAAPIAQPAAPQGLAGILLGALAPQPGAAPGALPAMPGAGPVALPATPPLTEPGWMDDIFGPGQITDMAQPVPVEPRPVDPDLQAAILQAQQIGPGLEMAGGLADIKQAGDHVVSGGLADALGYQIDPQAQADLQESLIGGGAHRIAEALPGSAALSDRIAALPMNPAASAVGQAESFGEGLTAALDDPLGVLKTYGVRSLGTSVPTMLAAIAGSAMGGPVGAAVGAGGTGAGIETAMSVGSAIEGAMRAAGVDVSNPGAVSGWINANPEAFDGMLETALARAGVIAATDAATGGITGQLARTAARAGRPGTIAGHIAAGGVVEPLGEAAGEAGAQLATTGQVKPGDVLAEALGGAGVGVPTTAGQVAVEAMRRPVVEEPVARLPLRREEQEHAGGPQGQLVDGLGPVPGDDLASLIQQYQPQQPARPTNRFADLIPQQAAQPSAPPPIGPMLQPEGADVAGSTPQPALAAPLPEAAVTPPSPPPVQAPSSPAVVSPEPPAPQKRPFARLIRQAGIQVDPGSKAGAELKAGGITPRTHPGLFRKGAHTDLDNIPAAEHPELAELIGAEGDYLPPRGIIDSLVDETRGAFLAGADQMAVKAARDEWLEMQAGHAAAWQAERAADAPPAWRIAPAADEMFPEDRPLRIKTAVAEAVRELGVTVTPEEVSAIVGDLDRDGGDVEYAIERAIIRSIENASAVEGLATEREVPEGVPGFGEDEGAGTPRPAGRDGVPEGRGDQGDGEPRRAGEPGPEAFPTEQTPEGTQLLVPGTEVRQTGEAQRQKAEIAARQQQSKIRRAGQSRIEDDEGSLFGEAPPDLFAGAGANGAFRVEGGTASQDRAGRPAPQAEAVAPSGAARPTTPRERVAEGSGSETRRAETPATRTPETVEDRARPGGRLSPRFLDFSFTNRTSVYGAAFRAAGVDPDEARNLPIEQQLGHAARALTARFGVQVQMPNYKVRRKNLVGRIVSIERPQITTREALDQLLDAFRQLQMLASIMGVPEKAMSLEIAGKPLVLSLVSTKRFGALGQFGWGGGTRTITLPGRSNSFAHEYAHALDHYLSAALGRDQSVYPMLSREMDTVGVQRPLHPKAALADAFAGMMRAVFGDRVQMNALVLRLQVEATQTGADGKPTPEALKARRIMADIRAGKRPPAAYLSAYFKSSAEYDRLSGSNGYFTDPAEMFARAFEAWTGRTVSAISDLPQGFLSKGGWGYDDTNDPRMAMTFPKGADVEAFGLAMLELQHAMSRVSLFGPDAPAARPDDLDIYSDKALLMRLPKTGLGEAERRAWRQTIATWRRSKAALKAGAASTRDVAQGVWLEWLTSLTDAIHTVAKRQNPEARAAFTSIADMIGNDPGSGRLIRHIYQQDVEMQTRRNLRRLDGALGKHYQHRDLTADESATLRKLLTGQNPKNVAPHLKRLAADMRTILDAIWYDLKDAGIEVAYAPGYLPRIPDIEAIDADPEGFAKGAAKVYELMFEREVIDNDDADAQHQDINTVIRRLRSATLPTAEGETIPASRLTDADEKLIEEWRAAYTQLRRLQKEAEKNPLSTTIGDRIVKQEAEVERLQEAVLDMLKTRFGAYSAENWRARMRVGHMNDFDRMGPTSSFLKGRTLPPETDAMLEKWLQSDPLELTTGYIHAAARRAEYAKRFGPAGEKLEVMLQAAEKDGATSHDIDLVRKAVNSATGRFKPSSRSGERVNNLVFAWGTMALLGRATFSSLAEPVTAGLRSGQVRDSANAFVQQVDTLVRAGKREDLFELARVIGLVTSSIHETVMANRLGADSAGISKGMSSLLASFFTKTLLSPLTNFQRVANVPVAHAIIMRHLRKPSAFGNGELNELGIAQEDRADLLKWLEGLKGMPAPDDLLAPDGSFYNAAAELWANAVVRLTDQTIQNPTKSDRPIMANHPDKAAYYGIMSFILSFQRNILKRTLVRGTRGKGKVAGTAQVASNLVHAAPAVAMLLAAQFLATVAREAIFNPSTWKEKDDEDELMDWLLSRAFWRTGLTGVFDPVAQLFLGIKYERDLTTITAGPYLGYFLQNAMTMARPFVGRNSENTPTAEHNAARAFYQAIVQPLMMASIAAAGPAGPLTGLLSTAGIMWGSSPQASTEFATALTGPKGETYKEQGRGAPWWEAGGP